MRTREYCEALVAGLPEESVFVSSLGRTSEELHRLASNRTLFTDTMGDVAPLSLGMAVASHPLVVSGVDTDGSFLMNLSAIIALGSRLPQLDNYAFTVIDNGIYESGGGMPSRTVNLSWVSLFAAVGLTVVTVREPGDLPSVLPLPGCVIIAEVHNDDDPPDAIKPVDGIESSYAIEKFIARHRRVPYRRPALKS